MREIDDVLPNGIVNVVTGFGSEAGAPLAAHDDIRKIAFTGSTEVGREIMRSAADTITDITLELGGKSPVVVYPDADIETAVDVTMLAMFYNTGECCAAGTRLFVHNDIKEDFMDGFVEAAENLTMGDPLNEAIDLGPKVSDEQVQRTMEYIEAADEEGGTIVTGGEQPDDEALADGSFVTPTVIEDIDHDATAVQEEIFGPVEEVFEWNDYDEMIETANDVEYGSPLGSSRLTSPRPTRPRGTSKRGTSGSTSTTISPSDSPSVGTNSQGSAARQPSRRSTTTPRRRQSTSASE